MRPAISIVVPTRGRVAHVRTLLSSLAAAAAHDEVLYEVLLVDDSEPEDRALIEEVVAKDPNAKLLPGPPSVRVKRNRGWREAAADLVLFTDSDCVARPNLLSEHLARSGGSEVGGAAGVTTFVNGRGWLWESIRRSRFINGFTFARRFETVPWATCSNVSYKKRVLARLGGFEEDLPSRLGGDDADFGMRVNEAGLVIRSAPDAEVEHDAAMWMSLRALLDRSFRWGRADLHIYYLRRPERLVRRLCPQVVGVTLLLGGIGAAAAGAFGWPAAVPAVAAGETLALLVSSAITARSAGEPRAWRFYILDEVLGMVFEAGLLMEGARYRDARPLVLVPRRGPVLSIHQGPRWTGQQWGTAVLGLALATLVCVRAAR